MSSLGLHNALDIALSKVAHFTSYCIIDPYSDHRRGVTVSLALSTLHAKRQANLEVAVPAPLNLYQAQGPYRSIML